MDEEDLPTGASTDEVAPNEETYEFYVDWRAQKAVDRLSETAGDDRYGGPGASTDDIVSGMIQTISESVNEWWLDKDHSVESLRSVIEYGNTQVTQIDKHIRTVGSEDEYGNTVSVEPETVLERIALVTFRQDVTKHVRFEYADELKAAAHEEQEADDDE